jgi:hypothetical protein
MDKSMEHNTLLFVLSTLFTIVILLIGWIGVRLHNKVDEIVKIMRAIERELRGEFTKLDRRVTRIEDHPALAIPPLFREPM